MTPFAAVLLLLAGDSPAPALRIGVAQLTIRERIIRRVIVSVPPRRAPARIEWRPRKGPRCASLDELAGAVISAADSVDLILRGGERMRAEFRASCPALDFYSGFYVLPTADRRICADRDAIHARSGGECEITRFRRLKPVAVAAPAPPPGSPLPLPARAPRRVRP